MTDKPLSLAVPETNQLVLNELYIRNLNGYYKLSSVGGAPPAGILCEELDEQKVPVGGGNIFLSQEDIFGNYRIWSPYFLQQETYGSSPSLPAYGMRNENSSANSGLYQSNSPVGEVSMSVADTQTTIFASDRLESLQPIRCTSAGTASLPNFQLPADTSFLSGMYLASVPGDLGFSRRGVARMVIGSSTTTSENVFHMVNGSASSPAYSFQNQAGTGMFLGGSGNLGFSHNGSTRLALTPTYLVSTGLIEAGQGTAGAPTYSFTGDLNTGMYWVGADSIGISTGGTNRMTVNNSGVTVGSNGSPYSVLRFGTTGLSIVVGPGGGTNITSISIGTTMPNTNYCVYITAVPSSTSVSSWVISKTTTTFGIGFQNIGGSNTDCFFHWLIIA